MITFPSWSECERSKKPYIAVKPRRAWARVEYDLLPAGRELNDEQLERLAGLFRRYYLAYQRRMRHRPLVGAATGYIDLPLSVAEEFACRLAEVLRDVS